MEPVLYADVARTDVGNHLRHKEGVELGTQRLACSGIRRHFLLVGFHAANANAEDNAHTVLVDCIQVKCTVLYSHGGSRESKLAIGVHLAGLLAIDELLGVEVFNLAGELRLELRGIEMCDRSCTAHSCKHILPRLSSSIA